MARIKQLRPSDYDALIARLKDERQLIDNVIATVEIFSANAALVGPKGLASGSAPRTYRASVEMLRTEGRSLTTNELRQKFEACGVRFEAAALYGAVHAKKNCEIVRVGRAKWALKDSAQSTTPQISEDGFARKGEVEVS